MANDRRAWTSTGRELARQLGGADPNRPVDPDEALLTDCAAVLRWLDDNPAPRGLHRAAAELRAAASVLRNAAFARRSLTDRASPGFEAREAAMRALLTQGDDHIRNFMTMTTTRNDV